MPSPYNWAAICRIVDVAKWWELEQGGLATMLMGSEKAVSVGERKLGKRCWKVLIGWKEA